MSGLAANDESWETLKPKVKKEIPKKVLYLISATLLSACGIYWFRVFSTIPDSVEGGEVWAKFFKACAIFVIVAGALAWPEKRKCHRLLTFSFVLALLTALVGYDSYQGRQRVPQKLNQANEQEDNNMSRLYEFIQQGAVGSLPEFKPTGDTNSDALLQSFRGFYAEYFQGWRKMRAEMEALQEKGLADPVLLTNKAYLDAEIQKRIVGQQVIKRFVAQAPPMFERLRQRVAALDAAKDFRQGAVKSLDKWPAQYMGMFAAWIEAKKTEQVFLQFLVDNFADYKMKDGMILFGSVTNRQKYDEVARDVKDASEKAEGFQQRGMDAVEAAKLKLQYLDSTR